jgi:cytochrome P450
MPRFVVATLVPRLKPIMELRVGIKKQVTEVLSHADDLSTHEKDSRRLNHDTLFDEILSSKLPSNDLTLDRLSQEAMALTAAGVETVKSTITLALFHSLENPSIAARLKAELTAAIPDPTIIPPWLELEKLPYLSAVINEGFRMNYGTVQRSPRINRLHPMHYQQWTIPAGTAVGMDSYHMHTNPAVFPDPFVFRPERWLGNPKGPNGIQPLTNYLTTFGGGSRMCVAMNLAYLENFVTLAVLFRRHELRLWETERRDVEFAVDMITPMPHPESRGVRVIVG